MQRLRLDAPRLDQGSVAGDDAVMESREWANVQVLYRQAKCVFYDGCHGIYLAMDDGAVDSLTPAMFKIAATDDTVREHYNLSCPHRFVHAVWTADDPKDGVLVVVPEQPIETEGWV